MMKEYLLVGLGNPGKGYVGTRHNIGFEVMDAIANGYGVGFSGGKYGEEAVVVEGGYRVHLMKPTTFMNKSGEAVAHWVGKKGIDWGQILVVFDDLHLPFGKMRLRPAGGSGGHNGVKSITEKLGSSEYARLRLGIGDDYAMGRQGEYVLGSFTEEERKQLPGILDLATRVCFSFVTEGIEETMQGYN